MEFNRCFGCFNEIGDNDVCPECGYVQSSKPQKPNFLVPGTILSGRYIIGAALGAGGFGITYLAWDFEMERKVAIKEYFPAEFCTRSPSEVEILIYDGEPHERFNAGLKSFIDEAKRLAGLNSVNGIVHIFDVFSENNTAYIVMEYISGKSLKAILVEDKNDPEGNGGKIPYQQAIGYGVTILRELEVVHNLGIIHRDIAPDNIMIADDGKVKLIDFGASKNATSVYSKSYSVVFKSGYTPEEQYRSNGNQGPWTDIYAMSATLYRMITGHVPYDANDRKSGKKVLKKPSELGIDIPGNVEVAIMNGLNVYAENRYQSAKEFADVLEGLVPAQTIPEKIKVQSDYKLSKRSLIMLSSGLVVAAALFVLLISTGTLKTLTAERLPNVIEMSVEQAANTLLTYGYEYIADENSQEVAENKIRIADMVFDRIIPENMILSQSPNAGAKVNKDKYPDIYLVLSAGAKEVYLPDDSFIGSSKDDTVKALESLGLVVKIEEQHSNEIAAGYVCGQQYEAGTKLKEGDTVTITVSVGPEATEAVSTVVPNVVGLPQQQAVAKIVGAKLLMAVRSEEYSDSVPKGNVISQTPAAGQQSTSGATVAVVISKGSRSEENTRVPDVVYRTQSKAASMLSEAGLNYSVEYAYSNSVAQGTVISQSVTPDSKVKIGTTVVITVSQGAANDSEAQRKQADKAEKTTVAQTQPATQKSTEKQTERATEKNTQKPTQTQPATQKPTQAQDNRLTIPNVVGTAESTAKSQLSSFSVTCIYGYSKNYARGIIAKQEPSAGTKAHTGTQVTLYVSVGSKEDNFSSWETTDFVKDNANYYKETKTQYRSRELIIEFSLEPNLTGYETKERIVTRTTYGEWQKDPGVPIYVAPEPPGSETTIEYKYVNGQRYFRAKSDYFYYKYTKCCEWSNWGDAPISENLTTQVQTRTLYRYCAIGYDID